MYFVLLLALARGVTVVSSCVPFTLAPWFPALDRNVHAGWSGARPQTVVAAPGSRRSSSSDFTAPVDTRDLTFAFVEPRGSGRPILNGPEHPFCARPMLPLRSHGEAVDSAFGVCGVLRRRRQQAASQRADFFPFRCDTRQRCSATPVCGRQGR